MATMARTHVRFTARETAARPDFLLIGALVALACFGVLMVYTASAPRNEALDVARAFDMRRQALFAGAAAVAFLVASLIDERILRSWVPVIYVGAVLVLLAVFPFGDTSVAAQRWLPIGSYQLQPSEFAKPAFIVTLAAVLAPVQEGHMRWIRIVRVGVITAIPAVLIFIQPDLGTMLVFGFVALIMLFVAGTTMRQLVALVSAAIVGTVLFLSLGLLEDYQLDRLTGFLDQSSNLETANYNQYQSQVTIGSGQVFGKGLFQGDQTNLSFVPSQTTDFIFTAVGEQLGFMGGALVLLLYSVIVWRLLMAAANARTRFGQLVCAGAVAMIGFHVFVNVGMTLGLMPVTGLPLPFLSQGGSAMVAMALAVGLAHSSWLRRSPVPGERQIL